MDACQVRAMEGEASKSENEADFRCVCKFFPSLWW